MNVNYTNEERVVEEWGMMIVCSEHPDTPHRDEGYVSTWHKDKPGHKTGIINNHLSVRVKRTVTYTKWEAA